MRAGGGPLISAGGKSLLLGCCLVSAVRLLPVARWRLVQCQDTACTIPASRRPALEGITPHITQYITHYIVHYVTHYIVHYTFPTQAPVMLKWLVTGREGGGGGGARAGQEADPGVFSVSRSALSSSIQNIFR